MPGAKSGASHKSPAQLSASAADNCALRFRPFIETDRDQLFRLWKTCFSDDDDYISCFFDHFFKAGSGAAAEIGGRVVSAVHLIRGVTMQLTGTQICTYPAEHPAPLHAAYPATYGYALATDPEFRGKGIATELVKYAIDYERNILGRPVFYFLPAEAELYSWYKKVMDTDVVSKITSERFSLRELSQSSISFFSSQQPLRSLVLLAVPPEEYNIIRESLLSKIDHIVFSDSLIAYEYEICLKSGGGLYKICDALSGALLGCAAVETEAEGDTQAVIIREFVSPDVSAREAAKLISEKIPCKITCNEYIVRSPWHIPSNTSNTSDFAVISCAACPTGTNGIISADSIASSGSSHGTSTLNSSPGLSGSYIGFCFD